MREFWIFIGILLLWILFFNFFSCAGGCYFDSNAEKQDKAFFHQSYQEPSVFSDYNIQYSNDFCSQDLDNYFSSKNECCSSRLSCANGFRGHWDDNNQKCVC